MKMDWGAARSADVIVDLRADGTYTIVKDRSGAFLPREERLYAMRSQSNKEGEDMKCIVRTCPNDSKDGHMEGPICSPCASALKGDGQKAAINRIVASVLDIGISKVDIRYYVRRQAELAGMDPDAVVQIASGILREMSQP